MSVKVMGAVFDIEGLSPTLKFVLLAYADHASHDGTGIWPAVQSIANKTGYSKRTIQNATKELQKLGYMKKVGHHESGTNLWKIIAPYMGGAGDSPPGVQDVHPPHAGDSPKPLVNHHKEPKLNGIPENLNTSEFNNSWEDFKEHRKQIKKPMTPLAETRMLKKLSKYSIDVAIEMLDRSIENGWQGVFELDGKEQAPSLESELERAGYVRH